MAENLLKRLEELINTGAQLAPLGGFDFSGYNARLQAKYLEWRKGSLEALEQVGPIGTSYKNKIFGDQNGGFFFQSSALLILNSLRDLFEKVKASPELAAAPVATTPDASESILQGASSAPPPTDAPPGTRVLKPPPKKGAPAATMPAMVGHAPAPAPSPAPEAASPSAGLKKVYVIGEHADNLRLQLSDFLADISLQEVSLSRQHGQSISLEGLEEHPDAKYAFFVITSDDLSYVMFEIGHFVGKLGKNRVCVLHMTDVNFPKTVPGVSIRPIVVKLEEASFSIVKELKSSGYTINL